MQIREIMTKQVEIIHPDATLHEAAVRMRDGDFGALPVGENDRLIGIVTDRDIAVRAVAEGKNPGQAVVREVMSPEVTWCFEDQEVEEAAKVMCDKQIRRLPVLNHDNRLVGILALGDIATEARPPAGEALEGVSKPTHH